MVVVEENSPTVSPEPCPKTIITIIKNAWVNAPTSHIMVIGGNSGKADMGAALLLHARNKSRWAGVLRVGRSREGGNGSGSR